MRMRVYWLAAVGVVAALDARAQAPSAPINGPYVNLGVGYNYLESVNVSKIGVGYNNEQFNLNDRNVNYGSGFTTMFGPGWGFGNGLRLELDGSYSYNSVNQNGGGRACTNDCPPGSLQQRNGNESKIGMLVNVAYDFWDLIAPGISPFLAAGVGFQDIEQHSIDIVGTLPNFVPATPFSVVGNNSRQLVFAYDVEAGIRFSLASIDPGLSAYAEYQFLGTSGSRNYGLTFHTANVARPVTATLGNEANHSFIVGVAYAFWAPPPPPPPAPPPPPPPPAVQESRTYLVFFDWDRADLTDRARQIVAEAAQASQHVQTTRIEVNGYTDLSGTAAYNLKLSVRRAKTVQAELVRDGVPENEIEIHGFGESNPLVPTAQGVREPQNRRVEIILH